MQILVPWIKASTDLAVWERRLFAAGVEQGRTNRDRRANLERIIVVEGSSQSSDITNPVRWVMGMTEE